MLRMAEGAPHAPAMRRLRNCLDTWGSDSPYLETYTASLPGQVTGLNAWNSKRVTGHIAVMPFAT